MDNNIITSVQNSKIQKVRLLKQKKVRDELDVFLAEGDKLIEDAMSAGLEILDVFVLDEKADKFKDLINEASDKNAFVSIINEKVLSSISQTKSPQGIAAVIKKKASQYSDDILKCTRFAAILENLQDPGNLGTIIRTCDAVGVDFIVMENCTDIYNSKVIRASMGSIFNIPIYEIPLHQCIESMKSEQWQVGCGHLHGENFYLRKQKQKAAIIIGNESQGVSEPTSKLCTDLWKLPMKGKADSLNASIAAGIMLYDIQNKFEDLVE
ncbi:MAG: RNA methyltransferase [Eubacteriales bacterium]